MTGVQWLGLWVVLACVLLGLLWAVWEHGHRTGRREGAQLARVMHARLSERLAGYAPHDVERTR